MPKFGEPFASFLPLGLLDNLHRASENRPAAVQFPAATMFVDVSRFTSLVEQLANRGREGLAEVPALLERSYARCVEHVYQRGGEVLYFAGDALLAYWPATHGPLGDSIAAAVACAQEICAGGGEHAADASPAREVALRVGVGAGSLWAAAVGGTPSWDIVVGGDAVTQAATAQAKLRRWNYALSPHARAQLGGPAPRPTPARLELSGAATAAPPAESRMHPEWLAGFLPGCVRQAFLGASGMSGMSGGALAPLAVGLESLSDTRPATVLFTQVTGLPDHHPDALGTHQTLCTALQRELGAREGPDGRLLIDDKGLVFVAVFGEPGRSHRDDASRAVDAAGAITAVVRGMGLQASTGVATGDVLFRVVGNDRRRQLMALGAPMNRAARLMAAAASDVLCDAATERAARGRFQFQQRGVLQLVGLGDAAAVFSPAQPVSTPAAAPAAPTALIGRDYELGQLEQAMDEVRAGNRRLVVVLGAPGIGKTRLVDTFRERTAQAGTPVALARAERGDQQTSFLPWRRVLASLLGLPTDVAGGPLVAALQERFAAQGALLDGLALLGSVLGAELAETDVTRHLEGRNRADAAVRLFADLLGRLIPDPVAIVLEDSQWLDSGSWRLAEAMLATTSSLLLVLCVRAGEQPAELGRLQQRTDARRPRGGGADAGGTAAHRNDGSLIQTLELQDLSPAALEVLVARTLGEAPPEEELARLIAARAGGNPFLAEEIALTLKSERLIAIRSGRWRPIGSLATLRHFDGVERVIRERVDRLDPTAQRVLKAAAVIGRSFSPRAVHGALGGELDAAAVAASLRELVAAHLVRARGGPQSYEFRHDQTRDVVYGFLAGPIRQRLHGNLATWLESTQTATSRDDIAVLVRHFDAAGERGKVVRYADLAGAQALRVGAFREAESFFRICVNEETGEPRDAAERLQAVRWRRQLGEALYSLGDLRAQSQAIRRALSLAGESAPRTGPALTRQLLARIGGLLWRQIWRRRRARPVADLTWERELARCRSQAAIIDYFELHLTRAFLHALAALYHAERAGISAEFVAAAAQLACSLGISRQPAIAGHFMKRAEDAAIAIGDPSSHAQVCSLDALWRIGHAQWPAVDQRLDQAQELAMEAGDHLTWCNVQAIRFWSLYYRGENARLEEAARALLTRAQSSGNLQQEVWALRCKALVALLADRPGQAVDILNVTAAAVPETADLAEQISSGGCLALALMRTGQHRESIDTATATLQLMRRMVRPTVHSTLPGIAAVAEVFLRGREAGLAREYDEWPRWERTALRALARYRRAFVIGTPRYALWSGVARWLDGDRRGAIPTLRHGLTVARALSLRHDEVMLAAELRRCGDGA